MYELRVAEYVFEKAHLRYGEERSASGRPSEYDFVGGPLAAAIADFRSYHDFPEVAGPTVRSMIVSDPFFGAVVFVAARVGPSTVEIADFADDPDYWSIIEDADHPE
ncbi:MAG: hypothetical protein AAGD33_21815 [Actinomycetota bacterium]